MCQTSLPSNFEETEGENGIGVEGRRGKEEVKEEEMEEGEEKEE